MTLLPDPVEKFQDLLNRLVQEDRETLAAIRALAGKIVIVEVAGPELRICLQFNGQGITLLREFDGKPHVTIRARPATFMGLFLNRNGKTAKPAPDMDISGDVVLAQDFQNILKQFDIDWEEHLSYWVGDTAAHKLGRIFRHTRACLQEARHTIGMDLSEYLRYEKNLLPERDEVEEFIAAVDSLRNDAERIKQRIARLQGRITTDMGHHG